MSEVIRVAMMEYDGLVREGVKRRLENETDLCLVGEVCLGQDLFPLLGDTQPDVLIFGAHVPQSQRTPFVPMRLVEALEEMGHSYPQVTIILLAQHYFPLVNKTRERVRGYILRHDLLALELATAVRTVHQGDLFYSETASQEIFYPLERGREYNLDEAQVAILALIAYAPHVNRHQHAEALGMSYDAYQIHLRRACRALQVTDRLSAVLRAMQMGILRMEDF